MPTLNEEEYKTQPIALEEWDEIIGIARGVQQSRNIISIILYIPATGTHHQITIPRDSTAITNQDIDSISSGMRIGILRVPGHSCQYRIRKMGVEQL
jgi:hypothetical protein